MLQSALHHLSLDLFLALFPSLVLVLQKLFKPAFSLCYNHSCLQCFLRGSALRFHPFSRLTPDHGGWKETWNLLSRHKRPCRFALCFRAFGTIYALFLDLLNVPTLCWALWIKFAETMCSSQRHRAQNLDTHRFLQREAWGSVGEGKRERPCAGCFVCQNDLEERMYVITRCLSVMAMLVHCCYVGTALSAGFGRPEVSSAFCTQDCLELTVFHRNLIMTPTSP